ncbi:carbohydrate porin [Brucella cytisi]|uniref:carbohydrate porin n=1 Tax=Brucella cytisi TaxID=407152 RepID=UPI0035D87001
MGRYKHKSCRMDIRRRIIRINSPSLRMPQLNSAAIAAIITLLLFTFAGYSYADPAEIPNCIKYDLYNARGSEVPFPSNCESMKPDLGGLRQKLFENGSNIQIFISGGFDYDLNSYGGGLQLYGGQKPTYTSSGTISFTHDLEKYGLPYGSLFLFAPVINYNSFSDGGITGAYISQMSGLVPFYDNRIIVQFGYYNLSAQFYGQTIGNNFAASALGPQSVILNGLGAGGLKPTPAFDIRMYSPSKRFYNHFGVARSISPLGIFADAHHNSSGLSFATPDAGVVLIDEVGYRVEASADTRKIWLRSGAVYNTSEYPHLNDPDENSNNLGFYGVGDIQLTQPNTSLPYQGWYINGRVDWSLEEVNAFAYDWGATLYRLGTFRTRPYDVFSLGISTSYFSRYAQQAAKSAGIKPATSSGSYSASYTYRLRQGAYIQSALTYTDNPTFAPVRKGALNAHIGLTLFF